MEHIPLHQKGDRQGLYEYFLLSRLKKKVYCDKVLPSVLIIFPTCRQAGAVAQWIIMFMQQKVVRTVESMLDFQKTQIKGLGNITKKRHYQQNRGDHG